MPKGRATRATQARRKKAQELLNATVEFVKEAYPIQIAKLPKSEYYGECVRHFRRNEAKMSLRSVAAELGISAQALSQIERGGRSTIDLDMLYRLTVILGCSVDNLLGRANRRGYMLDETTGKEYKLAIRQCPPRTGDYIKAYEQIYRQCPELANKLIDLGRRGTLADFKRTLHFIEENILGLLPELGTSTS